MSTLTAANIFEDKLNYVDVRKYINAIKEHISPKKSLKKYLKDVESQFFQDKQLLTDLQHLGYEELKSLNQHIRKFNEDFDQLNNLYHDKNYMEDGEIKQLFTSISRQAHRVENLSHKYLFIKEASSSSATDLKIVLANVSTENIGTKLSSEN